MADKLQRRIFGLLAVMVVAALAVVSLPSSLPVAHAQQPGDTIADIVEADRTLSALISALELASADGPTDFVAALSDPDADLTLFAPTNRAFAMLDPDLFGAAINDPRGLLTDILTHHVAEGSLDANALLRSGSAITLAGNELTIELRNGLPYVNDSQIEIFDIQAANGIVHVIDAVLIPEDMGPPLPPPPVGPTPTATPDVGPPLPPPPLPSTIADLVIDSPNLSTLLLALQVASDDGPTDFVAAASDPGANLTFFAPTDAAFDQLDPTTLDAILSDPSGLLTEVLAYHVLGSAQTAGQLVTAGSATTLQGGDVTIELRDGRVVINDSLVISANRTAVNGVIHVIDTVLLPELPVPVPVPGSIVDGAHIQLRSAVSGRWLDGDVHYWGNAVNTSSKPSLDDVWRVEQAADGYWHLINADYGLYLDADSSRNDYDVNLRDVPGPGTQWDFIKLDNGNYLLRTVDYDRYLDYDRSNVDTSQKPRADDEWQVVVQPGPDTPAVAPPAEVPSASFTYTLTATVDEPTLYTAVEGEPFVPTFRDTSLSTVSPWGTDLVYPVIVGTPEDDSGWAKVRVPAGGNDTTAWVQTSQFDWSSSNTMIQVSLSTNMVTVFDGDTVVFATGAVTGKQGSRTPIAKGFVEAFLPAPSLAYGPGVIPIGVFSTDLGSFGGALPRLSLHGTNRPQLIGQYASNGNVRVENSAFDTIRSLVTVGSKVEIVP